MGFPENVLTSGERVRPGHAPALAGGLRLGADRLLLLAVMIYVAWLTPDDRTGNWIQWIAVAIGVLIAVFLVVMPILRWLTTRYVVTTHRVLVRRGIVTKTGKDITLSKITDVRLRTHPSRPAHRVGDAADRVGRRQPGRDLPGHSAQ